MPFGSRRHKPLFLSTVAGGALAAALLTPAMAQEAPGQIEEIVVTAQKRSENVKDVPSSVSVFNQAALSGHNIETVEDLTRSAPSISFNAGGTGYGVGVGETNIEIRGVSSSSGASTVGVYFDDVAVNVDNKNGIGAPEPMLFDLARIEVLRGPQGTLFGAGSEGGTVRYIFNPASVDGWSGEASGEVSGTYHGGANYETTAAVNGPIVPGKLGIVLDAGYRSDSGWIDNYSLDGALRRSGVNDDQTRFGRIAATIKLGDDVTLTPQFIYQEIRSADSPVFYLDDTAFSAANAAVVPPPLATDGLYRQHKEVPEPTRDYTYVPSLTGVADLGFADLTSVTSWYGRDYYRVTDGTTYDSYLIAVDFLGRPPTDRVIATLPSPAYQPVSYQTWSQELRLTSHLPGEGDLPVKWVAGLYFNDQQARFDLYDVIPNFAQVFQSVYGYGVNSAQSPIGYPSLPDLYKGNIVYGEQGQSEVKQYAGFGQIDYDILPVLHASAGIRTTYATSFQSSVQSGFIALGNFGPDQNDTRYYSTTPRFSLVYDLTGEATAYATAGKGFRLGGQIYTPLPQGPNNACSTDYKNVGFSDTPGSSYGSDSLWSYEVGTKGRALDDKLSFDAAGFYIDWSKLQQAVLLPICGYYDTVNIGDAESYGAELELHYKLPAVPGLTLGFTGGITRAVLTSSINTLAARPGQNILFTPRWTATGSIDYDLPVTDAVTGFVRWDYDRTGPSNGSYQESNPNYLNPSYGVMNLTVGADIDAWQVSVFAKNLLNDHTIIQSPTVNSLVEGYTVQPLTIGLRVNRSF
jgi:outer membrane receptor protein involved in Fe transport